MKLLQQNSNEQSPNVGDIFFNILGCAASEARKIDYWLSQIHSKDEIRELQRLLKRPVLVGAFREVAQIPALGRELLPGNIGSVLRLRCDEEIAHYLSWIRSAWGQLLDGIPTAEQRLDPQTVATLRLRNVRYCKQDCEFLESQVRTGSVFHNFQSSERQTIWRNMQRFSERVPSLGVFFEDFKYFEDVAICVKSLLDMPRGRTVSQVLNQSFIAFDTDVARPTNLESDRVSREQEVDTSRRRLFLFAMQNLEGLRPTSVLLEQDGVRNIIEAIPHSHAQLAKEAHKLGFRSSKIAATLNDDPDRIEARRSLLRARNPQCFAYDHTGFEALIDRLVATYAEAERIETPRGPCDYVVSENGECLKRRCGKPYKRAFAESAPFLTLENMHRETDLDAGELSSIYVRRDVYLAFFGPFSGARFPQITGENVPRTNSIHNQDLVVADLDGSLGQTVNLPETEDTVHEYIGESDVLTIRR